MSLALEHSMAVWLRAGSNFERSGASEQSKSADFSKLGLTGYSGDKVISQRDIQRLVRPAALQCNLFVSLYQMFFFCTGEGLADGTIFQSLLEMGRYPHTLCFMLCS